MSSATEMVPPIPYNSGTESESASLVHNSLLGLGQRFQTVLQHDEDYMGTTDLARMRRMGSKGKCSRGLDMVQPIIVNTFKYVKGLNRTI